MSTYEDGQHTFMPFAQEDYKVDSSNTTLQANGLLSQMWHTRPVRMPKKQGGDAKVAGVCEGIGIRYQVDPTLIRLAFVVFGCLGAGFAAYALAWLLMPRYSVPISPLEAIWKSGHPKDRTHGWWLLIFFIFFSGIFSSGSNELFNSTSLLTFVLLAAMWWGLHKKNPLPPRGLLANGYDQSKDTMMNSNSSQSNTYPEPQPDLGQYSPAEGYSAPFAQNYQPTPSWDPLTQAQQNSWDTQVPAYYHGEPDKKKHRVWPWVLGGLIGTGALVVPMVLLMFVPFSPVHFEDDSSKIGDVAVAPSNSELQDSYSSGVGEMDINLSNLTPLDASRDINISSGIGEVKLILPDNVPVNLTCTSGIGTTHCDIESRNDGLEGEMLNIHVNSGIGDVDVMYQDQD